MVIRLSNGEDRESYKCAFPRNCITVLQFAPPHHSIMHLSPVCLSFSHVLRSVAIALNG